MLEMIRLVNRNRVADFWDDYIQKWILGDTYLDNWLSGLDDEIRSLITKWSAAYKGSGRGVVDLSCYPDPFYGDLRGERYDPAITVLGLNPGIGHPSLQSRQGQWTGRIQSTSFSRCFDRIPLDSPEWRAVHGKESRYWRCIHNFAERITGHKMPKERILNIELYPWHSTSLAGKINLEPAVAAKFILGPLSEVDTHYVFAFGKSWWLTAKNLGFEVLNLYGNSGMATPGTTCPGWHVAICAHESMSARLVISWQPGNSNPPGLERTETLKKILRAQS